MGKRKNRELNNKLNQTVYSGSNPWDIQPNVQDHLQGRIPRYNQATNISQKPVYVPQYDIGNLMDKLGHKMPPGVKYMLEQFMNIIPDPATMNSPNFKKEMKKKMKNFNTVFKSPYE